MYCRDKRDGAAYTSFLKGVLFLFFCLSLSARGSMFAGWGDGLYEPERGYQEGCSKGLVPSFSEIQTAALPRKLTWKTTAVEVAVRVIRAK